MPERPDGKGTCNDCGAQVLWINTANGKRMALNAEPVGRYYVLESATMTARQRNVFSCHFDTCKGRR